MTPTCWYQLVPLLPKLHQLVGTNWYELALVGTNWLPLLFLSFLISYHIKDDYKFFSNNRFRLKLSLLRVNNLSITSRSQSYLI